jgi:hypothetical protein
MKTVLSMAFVAAATLGAAAAQDTQTVEERTVLKKILVDAEMVGAKGGFLGATVKGAPYSGEELTESTQVLADGTRIHNESRATVYRDSEGRVRRESPDAVTIWDPVLNASFFVNTKDQTYRQMPLAVQFFSSSVSKDGTGGNFAIRVGTGGPVGGGAGTGVMLAPPPPPPGAGPQFIFTQKANKPGSQEQGQTEALGHQTMEGVAVDGTRQVSTIETGAIGNDRPIQVTSERWYSQELQTVVLTRHNDPRTGEVVFHLTNVSRSEPPANLFTAPAGYQRLENK